MVCSKCGTVVVDGSEVCPKCGMKLSDERGQGAAANTVLEGGGPAAEGPGTEGLGAAPEPAMPQTQPKRKLWMAVGAVAAVVILVFAVNWIQAARLKKVLMKEWYDADGMILKVLEFDEDKVEYRLETGYAWMDTTLFDDEYKVVSGKTIKIKYVGDKFRKYKIELSDDKKVMTITPAVTSTDPSERWYDIY